MLRQSPHLHYDPLQVFVGDQYAINQARQQLRVEFLRNKDVRDPHELRT